MSWRFSRSSQRFTGQFATTDPTVIVRRRRVGFERWWNPNDERWQTIPLYSVDVLPLGYSGGLSPGEGK